MGFLKRFFRNVFRDGSIPVGTSSFEHLSEEELEAHLGVSRYGDFHLTDAVRPSYDLQVIPCQGYRHDRYRDEESRSNVPVLMGAASKPYLFDAFLDLLDPLGSVVDVVFETNHNRHACATCPTANTSTCRCREHPLRFEDLLLNDGCTGKPSIGHPPGSQFDEHKLLIVYGENLADYEQIRSGNIGSAATTR